MPALLVALDRLTVIYRAVEELRAELASGAPVLVAQALRGGVDPGELVRRPYSQGRIRQIGRDAGIPAGKPGPRPARRWTVEDMRGEDTE